MFVKGGVLDIVWLNCFLVVKGQTLCRHGGRGVPVTPNGNSVPDCQGGNPVPGPPVTGDMTVPRAPVTTDVGAGRLA